MVVPNGDSRVFMENQGRTRGRKHGSFFSPFICRRSYNGFALVILTKFFKALKIKVASQNLSPKWSVLEMLSVIVILMILVSKETSLFGVIIISELKGTFTGASIALSLTRSGVRDTQVTRL
jgi:hypothetical protein